MSTFSTPIWNSNLAGLIVRIPIGLYFFMAGRMKLENVEAFIQTVRQFGILPDEMSVLYGVMLPWLEVIIGVALVVGIWTTATATLASAMLMSFIIAIGITPVHPNLFNKDFMLLGGTLSLLCSGAGLWSVDNFRKSGG